MVSKRPGAEPFANADVTVGNFGLRQGTFDLNRPLSENGKAAFRVAGLVMNSDDATDHVYYRNRYIAPSLSLDLGPRTDFTILTSYQEREYLRQQGLPVVGSVQYSPNGRLPLNRFTGEPGQDPYKGYQTRIGYALTHRFDSGWTLNQNVRRQDGTLDGQLVAITRQDASGTLTRSATDQRFENVTTSLDTNIQRVFQTGFGKHEITLGSDYIHSSEDTKSKRCTVDTLNVYNPVYGSAITCPTAYNTNSLTTIRSFGIYARDQIQIDRWRIVAGLRRDHASTYSDNNLDGSYQNNPANATTGSAAVMYEILPGVRPYVSYTTSFSPNTGVDAQGQVFDPETGRQLEAGVKVDLDGGATAITVAAFDLRRRNVVQSDGAVLPDGSSAGTNIAVGEQRTRGAELGFASDLRNGLSLFGGYAYTASEIVDAGPSRTSLLTVGNPLNNVPRHSFTVSSRYRFKNELRGWDVMAGIRGEGKKFAYSYDIPGYIVGDIGVGYTAARWRAALNLKNVLDQRYYVGGVAAAVAVGNSRTVMLTMGYRY
jgi:iron complex outermembrane receptor protein